VDPISLSQYPPDDHQSRAIQIPADPVAVLPRLTNRGHGRGHPAPRQQDHLVVCAPPPRPNPTIRSTIHIFRTIRGALVHGSRGCSWMGGSNANSTWNLARLAISSRTFCSQILYPDEPPRRLKPRTPSAGAGRYGRNVTVQCILDILRGCPLLETLLITESRVLTNLTPDHPPVSIPRLRSIELGEDEVRSGLATHPQNVAAGLRVLFPSEVCGEILFRVGATMQHVLRRIYICYITLAKSRDPQGTLVLLVRFEGLYGSLEITTGTLYSIWTTFGPGVPPRSCSGESGTKF